MSAKTSTDPHPEVDLAPEWLAPDPRERRLLEQVRHRRLGFSKAAELTGLPQSRFLDRMRELRITPFDLDTDELPDELA